MAYSVIGSAPTAQSFGGSSLSRAAPMRIPSRGSAGNAPQSSQRGTLASSSYLADPASSFSFNTSGGGAEDSMRKFMSLSVSSKMRRSVASSPTVSPPGGDEGIVFTDTVTTCNVLPSLAVFAPKAVTVGFDTAAAAALSPNTKIAMAVSSNSSSPFRDVAGPGFGAPAMPSNKPPRPQQGLLSKALSLTEMQQAAFATSPLEATGPMFFPDVDLAPLREMQEVYPVFKQELVITAYCVAARAHRHQLRKNGAPMLSHCLDVAKTLASIGLDAETVAAGLVHEVLVGSSLYQSQLEEFMPSSVMSLVERVNTISEMSRIYRKHRDDFGDEKFRRMLVAMEDVKSVLIKLADRVHNMRTIGCLPRHKQIALAQETLEVYSAVANRLGIWCLKAELEDLAFKTLHPEEYEWLKSEVSYRQDAAALEDTMSAIKHAMRTHNVQVEDISGRPKNLYGIWIKMQNDGHRDLSRIFDVTALRVVVSNKHECYTALRALQSVYRCMPERSKDFIRDIKKPNGYQSLHETIIGEGGRPMEVQIRTHKMHYIAEYGFAAHWKYKEKLDSEDEWLEKETQYKRWLTQYKLGLLDKKVRPEGAVQDASLKSLGVAYLDQVAHAPDAVDPFLRHDRFKLQAPVKSEVSVLLHTQDSIDTRTFPLGTTAAQLWDTLGVNDLPGYALTVNSRLPAGECALRSGDLVQVVPLSQVLSRSPPGAAATLAAPPSSSIAISVSGSPGSSALVGGTTSLLSASLKESDRSLPVGGFARASFVSGRGLMSAAGGPARAVRVGGF